MSEIAAYRDRLTGQYPVSMPELRRRAPDVGLPAVFDGEIYDLLEADPVSFVAPPEYDFATHTLTEGVPVLVEGGWQQTWVVEALPVVPPVAADINAERDRRTVSGFTFGGVRFQSRPEDRENIMGAFALASAALTIGGKAPGDLRWHGGGEDFVFIAENDTRVPMDAVTVLGLGQAAAKQKSDLTFAANDLKKFDPIPANFADDEHWPAL